MDFFYLVLGIVLIIILYFFIGIILKFMLVWFPLIIGSIISLILILLGGYVKAIIAFLIFFLFLMLNNKWQSSQLFFQLEKIIDKFFYFKD